MPNYQLQIAMGTHTGIRRDHNEDAVGYHYPSNFDTLTKKGVLLVIADGVGSLDKGEQASEYTVNRVIELYYLSASNLSVHDALKSSIEQTNQEVFKKFDGHSASTIVAVVIRQSEIITAYVGDSRAYIFDGQAVRQYTTDHVSSVSVGNKRRKNKLTRAVGHRYAVEVDMLDSNLEVGTAVLMLTDGASLYLSEDDLRALVVSESPTDIVRDIIQYSNQGGGLDNISAIVVFIDDSLPDASALEHHLNQLPEQVIVNYTAPTHNNVKPRRRHWRRFLLMFLIFGMIIMGLLVYIQTINQDISASITQMPALATDDPSTNVPTEPASLQSEPEVTQILLNEVETVIGREIIFDEVAVTTMQLASDTSSFLIIPEKTYRIFTTFTNENDQTWYQIHDEETDRKGWISAEDLPSYTLVG